MINLIWKYSAIQKMYTIKYVFFFFFFQDVSTGVEI